MNPSVRAMLNEQEQELLRSVAPAKLRKLDEDELIELHGRIRRARTKYIKMHRRRGTDQVRSDRSRTRASGAVSATAMKAEAFEEALSAVSERLARVAASAAKDLKRERLTAAAAATGSPHRTKPASKSTKSKATSKRTASRSAAKKAAATRSRTPAPIDKKRSSATRAATKRSQTRRDTRR